MVDYNVQTAVDAQHHLIVAHEVVTTGSDRSQLTKMVRQAREAMGVDELPVLADRGYFKSEEFLACAQAGIATFVPKPQTSGNQARGLFRREDFRHEPESNEYRCPAGEQLTWRYETVEGGLRLHCYWSSACPHCAIKVRCTTGAQRRVKRWEHEAVLEAAQARLDHEPGKLRLRRQTVAHPFGTLKTWMGHWHFLTRTLPRVSTEISLHVLAYNMKRVMKSLGVGALVDAVATT